MRLAGGAAIAVWLLAYANSVNNGFHFDDDHVIERNVAIRSLANVPRFFVDARTFSTFAPNANYRPLVSTTLAIDYAMAGGLRPVPFHITQLFLCLLVGVLFLLVSRSLLDEASEAAWHPWAALFAAAFFCLHTGNTELANYICARSEQLCAAGVLGSLLLYLRAPRLRLLHLHLLPMMVGALAKTPSVIYGPLLLAYKLIFEAKLTPTALRTRDGWRRGGRAVLGSLPTLVVSGAVFHLVEGMSPPGQSYAGSDRVQYLWSQTWVWLRYLKLFVLPTGLSADSDQELLPSWLDPRVFAGVAVLLLSLVIAARSISRPERRPFALGIVWFWLGIAPSSSWFPLAEITNDHRMYLGWLGLTLAVAALVFERASAFLATIPQSRGWRIGLTVAAVLLLGAHAFGTAVRNRAWLTEESLWHDVVQKSPGNGRGWMNYGLTQMARGQYAEARSAFERAAPLTPNYSLLSVNRGILANVMGDPATAEVHFKDALRQIPQSGSAPYYYGRFLVDRGRAPEAIPLLRHAQELDSGDPRASQLLLQLAAAHGARDEVRALANQILSMGPDAEASAYAQGRLPFVTKTADAPGWFQTGIGFTNATQHASAAQAYRMALDIDPSYADAWNNLGWSLHLLGFEREAIDAFEHTLKYRPTDDRARNNLSEARRRLTDGTSPQPRTVSP